MYNILIADDHPLLRDAIVNIIKLRFDNCVTFETNDLQQTLDFAAKTPELDLILLDLNMPGMNGFDGLISLRNQSPTIPVVIVSAEQDKKIILQTIAYGAVGFVTKSSSKETIADALASVLAGDVYLPPAIIRDDSAGQEYNSFTNAQQHVSDVNLSSLTRRQLMVLKCLTKGHANKQIADDLNISETTVKSHVSVILKKLGVYNRVQAVVSCTDIDFNQYLKR
ncbi:MAG: response regulator transcription factor [Gammaproteobacteria bacterium]|nr:response regulator transcription factor [Gammaproteobacteria bacterium]